MIAFSALAVAVILPFHICAEVSRTLIGEGDNGANFDAEFLLAAAMRAAKSFKAVGVGHD